MTTVELVQMQEWGPGENPHTSPGHTRWALRDVQYRDEPADGPNYGGLHWQGYESRDDAIADAGRLGLTISNEPVPETTETVATFADRARALSAALGAAREAINGLDSGELGEFPGYVQARQAADGSYDFVLNACVETPEAWFEREVNFAFDAHEMTSDLQRELQEIFGEPEDCSEANYVRAAQLIACRRMTCGGPNRGHEHIS